MHDDSADRRLQAVLHKAEKLSRKSTSQSQIHEGFKPERMYVYSPGYFTRAVSVALHWRGGGDGECIGAVPCLFQGMKQRTLQAFSHGGLCMGVNTA
jgi:hypothetical protein